MAQAFTFTSNQQKNPSSIPTGNNNNTKGTYCFFGEVGSTMYILNYRLWQERHRRLVRAEHKSEVNGTGHHDTHNALSYMYMLPICTVI